jgi:hypothetical protein
MVFLIADTIAEKFIDHEPEEDNMPFVIYDEIFEELLSIAFNDAVEKIGLEAARKLISCMEHAKDYDFLDSHIRYNANKDVYWYKNPEPMPLYRRAAKLGGAKDWQTLAHVYYEGRYTSRYWLYAFYWMLKAATHGRKKAMVALSGYLENGKGVEADTNEAYIWALMAKDCCSSDKKEELESRFNTSEQNRAHAETRRRIMLLKPKTRESFFQEMLEHYGLVETGIIEDPVVQMIQAPEPKVSKKRSRFGDISEEEKKRVEKLGEWEPDSPAEITMEYYLLEQKIRFRYKRKSVTVKATSVFEPSHLRLLKAFYDMKHKEGPNIAPKNNSIVGPDKRQLNNSLSYGFNNVFRKLFNKGKDFKAFYWDHMELKSKINLELK